ncbi:phospholipase D-like domain-containing protein [Rhizobium mongolense]|uniref:phospholipase D-like domain-containing protein n=1 Tax=Rhizobium mongolense TaxID=57676 RepID=UPI003556EAD3
MRTVHIIFPLFRGARQFKIEKGRRWSVIEHIVLQALTARPRTAKDIAEAGALPRRMVVEAITRLMQAGWVELRSTGSTVVFDATELGRVRSGQDELPRAIDPKNIWRSFYIDGETGSAFRIRELTTSNRRNLPVSTDEQIVHEVKRRELDSENLTEIFNALENQDEFIVGVYPSVSRLVPTFGIVTYRDGVPEGIPSRAPRSFIDFIQREYEKIRASEAALPVAKPQAPSAEVIAKENKSYLFENNDLILDGKEHRDGFIKLIKSADKRLLIHSGFVTENVQGVLPNLLAAAGREVRIDLFYGQDDDPKGKTSSENAIEFLKKQIAGTGLRERFHIHPFSTESHAKIAIADDRQNGWTALLGSCNWLASGFTSFDATVRVRDPRMVAELVSILARLSKGRLGVWTETATALSVLGRQISRIPPRNGRKAEMDLLYTKDHPSLVMDAARAARKRIFVLSHQFGVAGRPVTIFPLMDVAKSTEVAVSAFYGKPAGKKTAAELLDLRERYGEAHLQLRSIERPRLHAKVLGWDDDNLAVTSFNWLSVDPSPHKPLREVGLLIKSNQIAEKFLRDFDLAQWN